MNLSEAKEYILQQKPIFLEEAKPINKMSSYVCPVCGNGTGSDRTGIVLDRHTSSHPRYKCFKCGLYEDVIGLWKLKHASSKDSDVFKELYRYYDIDDDEKKDFSLSEKSLSVDTRKEKHDLTAYFNKCKKRISQTDYLLQRGLSEEIIQSTGIGYDPNYSSKHWKAIIIPTSKTSFVARNTDYHALKNNRYRKHGRSCMFNLDVLKSSSTKPIVVCEGEIDTLSVLEAGGSSVAIGSTANVQQFIDYVLNYKIKKTFILALDHDEAGDKARNSIFNKLSQNHYDVHIASFYDDYNDVNDMLVQDRSEFIRAIHEVNARYSNVNFKEAVQIRSAAHDIDQFIQEIKEAKPPIQTGFKQLDEILDGGLYPGLYVIGAMSSIGKTTYLIQMADQIANQGQDVIFFSVEMSKSEIMAKSISRLTTINVLNDTSKRYKKSDAKTMHDVLNGSWYPNYSEEERHLIFQAIEDYRSIANHLYIVETASRFSVDNLIHTVNDFILKNGTHPVVMLDYLQLVSIASGMSDKQSVDSAIRLLKQLSRNAHIPIIVISSFNRSSYHSEAAMDSFKESGGIEYGSDVLMGLQIEPKVLELAHGDINKVKRQIPRKVELVILKSRNSSSGGKIHYNYYPQYNYFTISN